MAEVIVYSTGACPYCVRAKELLGVKGVKYTEIRVDMAPNELSTMLEKTGGKRTVPQIFIGETHVGGFDDLQALQSAGKLDELLEK